VGLRDRVQATVGEAIRLGLEAGDFAVADVELATVSLLSLGTDVSRWFVPGKRLSPDALAEEYADMAVRTLSGRPALATVAEAGAPARG
jgi:hypothetical protein